MNGVDIDFTLQVVVEIQPSAYDMVQTVTQSALAALCIIAVVVAVVVIRRAQAR